MNKLMTGVSLGRLSVLTGAVLPLITGCSPGKEAESRPNIIMFMVDDMGWQDTSLPFWKEKTPFNLRIRKNITFTINRGISLKCPVCNAMPGCIHSRNQADACWGANTGGISLGKHHSLTCKSFH